MSCRSVLAGAAALLLPLLAGAAERLIIDHVTVIEGTGRAPQPDMAVLIQGARITAVTPSQLARGEPGRRAKGQESSTGTRERKGTPKTRKLVVTTTLSDFRGPHPPDRR